MRRTLLLLGVIALLATGCPRGTEDFDGDGIPDAGDCAPSNPAIFPGAPDQFENGVDNNCDGVPGVDSDGDGFASESSGGTDCNDGDSSTHPGAAEVPDNETDEDCDGESLVCDADGDGAQSNVPVCGGLDCDDFDSTCSTQEDCADDDGDGQVVCKGDCDDQEPRAFQDNPEVCDGIDNNCTDGVPSDEFDTDADGYVECTDWEGSTESILGGGDCDDDEARTWPGAPEQCDQVDNDCDGTTDEGVHDDADADGFSPCGGDCDDLSDAFYPQNAMWETPSDPDWDCSGDRIKPLVWATTLIEGTGNSQEVGRAVAGAGDIDADGLADVLVGAPGFSEMGQIIGGRSFAFFGATLNGQTSLDISQADGVLAGGLGGTFDTGERVAPLGDLDGDGMSEFLTASTGGGSHILVWPGSQVAPGGYWDGSMGLASFTGEGIDEGAGLGLSPAGDVDGDGIPDVLVGAPLNSSAVNEGGKAYLVLGASILAATQQGRWSASLSDADMTIAGSDNGDRLGTSVAGVGDVDGDGLDDVLIGAPYAQDGASPNAGKAYLFLGSTLAGATTLTAASADRVYVGAASSRAGDSVSGLGDINGDGYSDFAIGTAAGGTAYVVLGSASAPSTSSLSTAASTTLSSGSTEPMVVAASGDVDGDGVGDIAVGRPQWNQTGGAALVLASTLASTSFLTWEEADVLFLGEEMNDLAGSSLNGVGDINADGRDDVMFGAPNNSSITLGTGRAYLFTSPL